MQAFFIFMAVTRTLRYGRRWILDGDELRSSHSIYHPSLHPLRADVILSSVDDRRRLQIGELDR